MAKNAKVSAKEKKVKAEAKAETKKKETLKVDNSVKKTATQKYIALCDHTSAKIVDGKLTNYQFRQSDEFSNAEVPQVWIDQAVAHGWACTKKDYKDMSKEERRKRGMK
jgi:hypothetical protein